MKSETLRLVALVASALVVIATGMVLTQSGKPYSTALLTLHKLVDLGIVVAIGVAAYRVQQATPLGGGAWATLVATAVLVVAAFATGGAASAMAEPLPAVLWAHRVGSWLAAAGMVASGWIVLRG